MNNKLAIITGGSKGIGKAIAHKFLEEHINVYLLARKLSDLEETKKEFEEEFPQSTIHIASVDATSTGGIEKIIDDVFSGVDELYFVNNAGVWLPYVKESHDKDLQTAMDINFESPYRIARYLLDKFKDSSKKLSLITNLSHIVFMNLSGNENYKPTKVALTKAMFDLEETYKAYTHIAFAQVYPASTASDFAVENYLKGIFDAPTSLESVANVTYDIVTTSTPTNDVYIGNFQKDIPTLGLKKENIQGISRIYLSKEFKPISIEQIDKDFDVVSYMENKE